MLSARHVARAMAGATDQSAEQSVPGRTVLLSGEAARQQAGVLVETMQACGCQPAIVAALVPKHLGETLKGAAERVRCAMLRRVDPTALITALIRAHAYRHSTQRALTLCEKCVSGDQHSSMLALHETSCCLAERHTRSTTACIS